MCKDIFALAVTVSVIGTSTSFAQCNIYGVPAGFGLNAYESTEDGWENGIVRTFRGTSNRPPRDEVYPTGRTRFEGGKYWMQIVWRYPWESWNRHWGWVLKSNVSCIGGSHPNYAASVTGGAPSSNDGRE